MERQEASGRRKDRVCCSLEWWRSGLAWLTTDTWFVVGLILPAMAEISIDLIAEPESCSYNIYNVNFGHYQGSCVFITVVMIKNTTYSGSLSVDSRLVVWYSQPKLVRQKELIKKSEKARSLI